MSIIRVKKNKNYTVMSNNHLRDERLSWKAKGILSYLLSLPDDWKLYQSELKKHATDGKTSMTSGFDELIELGYISKKRERREDGTFAEMKYTVYEHGVIKPCYGKPDIGESDIGKQASTKYLPNKVLTKPNTNNTQVDENNDMVDKIKEHYDSKENLPGYRSITQARTKHINARLKDYSLETVKEVLDMADESTFLTDNLTAEDGKWYNFDWIFNPNNFIKILEGNYSWSNKKQSKVNYKDVYDDIPEGF